MKFFIGIFITLLMISSEAKATMMDCYSYGTGVSFGYASCVNGNFRSAASELNNSYVASCFNYSMDKPDYSFLSCINQGFQSVQNASKGYMYLSYCINFNRETLDYSFTSCVNQNFRMIEQYLANRDIN